MHSFSATAHATSHACIHQQNTLSLKGRKILQQMLIWMFACTHSNKTRAAALPSLWAGQDMIRATSGSC